MKKRAAAARTMHPHAPDCARWMLPLVLALAFGARARAEVSYLIIALAGAASYLLLRLLMQAEIRVPPHGGKEAEGECLGASEPSTGTGLASDLGQQPLGLAEAHDLPHRRASSPWRPCLASVSEQLPGQPGREPEEDSSEAFRPSRSRCSAVSAQTAGQLPALPAGCTTVALRGIPRKYTPDALTARLHDCGYQLDVDLLFLPLDIKKAEQQNVGYAIINFRTVDACQRFALEFHLAHCSEKLPGFKSSRACEVSTAPHQGLRRNVELIQASPAAALLRQRPEWLPRLFDTQGRLQQPPRQFWSARQQAGC